MNKLFYIIGKSASGKDKIYKLLLEKCPFLKPLVIYTTRPVRSGEEDGVQYHFVDREYLDEMEKKGRVIESRDYNTVMGVWTYCTIDDGVFKSGGPDIIAIGTLESYDKIRKYYGSENVIPLYIETEDGIRLERAIKRERKQEQPNFTEVCRRFLADSEDFSEENLKKCGITKRFCNNGTIEECLEEIAGYISEVKCE